MVESGSRLAAHSAATAASAPVAGSGAKARAAGKAAGGGAAVAAAEAAAAAADPTAAIRTAVDFLKARSLPCDAPASADLRLPRNALTHCTDAREEPVACFKGPSSCAVAQCATSVFASAHGARGAASDGRVSLAS